MNQNNLTYSSLVEMMLNYGVKHLYVKHLSENDNAKNQIYFGPGFSSIQLIPNQGILSDGNNFKAKVSFFWLDETGGINIAPGAQLILYPKYPEVRFSGFLKGANKSPSELLNVRMRGRWLIIGICDNGNVIGYLTTEDTILVKEIKNLGEVGRDGVFIKMPLRPSDAPRDKLLSELKRINKSGWIDSKRLTIEGVLDCHGTNCGGMTLESELGIVSNSLSEPDFMGYEVKQYRVRNFEHIFSGSAITLMTPEPQGGIYKTQGVDAFVRRFGYLARGREDRMNFSGIHTFNNKHPRTGLTLVIDGYDPDMNKITNVDGAIMLMANDDTVAASWLFPDIIAHWSRKHNQAVYVPSQKRDDPKLQYSFGHIISFGEKTDPLYLLRALSNGIVYYDPGIHLDNISSTATIKRRSQFRVRPKNLNVLYDSFTQVDLLIS